MKNILYIDCFSGISGDMMVGALIDFGMDVDFLRKELEKVDLEGYSIDCDTVKINSLSARKFKVKINSPQPVRSYRDIKKIINNSKISSSIKNIALKIFEEIAKAEAKVHNQNIEEVHFHEIGAVDTIIDVLGTAIGVNYLKPDTIFSRNIPLGSGVARTLHGNIPIPAPATLEILKGLPVYGGRFTFETTTPTGAAILKVLVKTFDDIPLMRIEKIGVGAGSIQNNETPNVLRIIKGSFEEEFTTEKESLILLSANIDDSTPELLGYLIERLVDKKVLDAWIEPIYMKKNRLAFKLCALCKSSLEAEVVQIIFTESTTLGIRREKIQRYILARKTRKIKLPYGEIEVKIGIYKGKEVTFSPEFESCKKLAKKVNKPLKEIYQDTILLLSSK